MEGTSIELFYSGSPPPPIITDNGVSYTRDTSGKNITNATIDSILKPIFGKVMLGNNDLVKQGSAYALTVSQYESQFSMNYSWMATKENVRGKYWNIGFSASSSSKVLPIFSKDEWQQGFSINVGIKVRKGSICCRRSGYEKL